MTHTKAKQNKKPQPKRSLLGPILAAITLTAAVVFGAVGVCLNTDKPKVAEDFKPAAAAVTEKSKHSPLVDLTIARHFDPDPQAPSLNRPKHYTLVEGRLTGKSADGTVEVSLFELEMRGSQLDSQKSRVYYAQRAPKLEHIEYKDANIVAHFYDHQRSPFLSVGQHEPYDGYDLFTQVICSKQDRTAFGKKVSEMRCLSRKKITDGDFVYDEGDYVDSNRDVKRTVDPVYFENMSAHMTDLSKTMLDDVNSLLRGSGTQYVRSQGMLTNVFELAVDLNVIGLNGFRPLLLDAKSRKGVRMSERCRTEVSRVAGAVVQEEFIKGVKTGTFYLYDSGKGKLVRQAKMDGVDYTAVTLWGGDKEQPVTIFRIQDVSKNTSLTIEATDVTLPLPKLNQMAGVVAQNARTAKLQR